MSKINKLRKKIDIIDDSIIKLLRDRFKTSKAIFNVKSQRARELNTNFYLIDYEREQEIKDRQTKNFSKSKEVEIKHDHDDQFVNDLMTLILTHSKKVQTGFKTRS